jgi:DUF917 family protein
MRTIITEQIARDIIAGASIFATGGGFEYQAQLNKLPSILNKDQELEILSVEELSDEQFICTAYGVGSAANTEVDLSGALAKGFEVMEEITGRKFAGIFAGETNIEALVFQTALAAGLPIVDADCTGGRAVPEIQFDNLFVAGKSILPLVAVSLNGDVAILRETKDPIFIEKFVRSIAVTTGNSVAVIDHPMSMRDAKRYLTLGIFERSRKVGKIINNTKINQNEKLALIIKESRGVPLLTGAVTEVNVTSDKGFLEGSVIIEGEGRRAEVVIKNESLVLVIDEKTILTMPDFITLIDMQTGLGLHNSKITVGQSVIIMGIKASALWRKKAGIKRFSPQAMGLSFQTTLL